MAGKKKATKAIAKGPGRGRKAGSKNKPKPTESPRLWALYRKTSFGLNDAVLVSTHVSRETSEHAMLLNATLNATNTYYVEYVGSPEGPTDA